MTTNPPSMLMLDSAPLTRPMALHAFQEDMNRTFKLLGVEGFRASLVDTNTLVFQAGWAMGDDGNVQSETPTLPLDSTFPGALAIISQLAQVPDGDTVRQRLSPRHWVIAWRLDDDHAMLAEARYRLARPEISPSDAALVRVVCSAGMGLHAQQQAAGAGAGGADLVWPAAPPPAVARRRMRLSSVVTLGLPISLAAALLAGWLAVVNLPALQGQAAAEHIENQRLRQMADNTLMRGLAVAMATNDYGEVQTALSSYEGLGYFQQAAVLNTKQRVVSVSGQIEGARIGQDAPPDLIGRARAVDLVMGSERYGTLLLLGTPVAEPLDGPAGTARLLAALAAAASAVMAVMLAVRWRRARAQQPQDAQPSQQA